MTSCGVGSVHFQVWENLWVKFVAAQLLSFALKLCYHSQLGE